MKIIEDYLNEIATDDLAGCGCYVVEWKDIAATHPGLSTHHRGGMAWTGFYLDQVLEDHLRGCNRWQGRGFSTIINSENVTTFQDTLGVALHELAHWLTFNAPDNAESISVDAMAIRLTEWASAPPSSILDAMQHPPRFMRAAAHLAHRAGKLVASVRPCHLRFSRAYTGYSEDTMMTALEGELDRCGAIRSILDETSTAKWEEWKEYLEPPWDAAEAAAQNPPEWWRVPSRSCVASGGERARSFFLTSCFPDVFSG